MSQPDAGLAGCCSAVYSHPAARWLLGESFHPGGLALTERLARTLELSPGLSVLDAGCGRGTSAVHLAKLFGCRVTGISLDRDGIEAARAKADRAGVAHLTSFAEGDLQRVDLGSSAFDAAIMECVLSTISEKPAALARIAEVLKPGGRLGLTDVTVSGPMPDGLHGVLAVVGCLGDARPLAGYEDLVSSAGLEVEERQDLPETAAGFLREIKGKLFVAEIATKVGKLAVDPSLIDAAKRLLAEAQRLVDTGALGYGLIIARRGA